MEIEHLMQSSGKTLKNYDGMPLPVGSRIFDEQNRLVLEELQYDRFEMSDKLRKYMSTINADQKKVFDTIMNAVSENNGSIYFVYGHGGTGKTYLWQTLSAAIRSQGEIVINVASSGIASLLLPGGRTAHSRFSIPLAIKENSTCTIKKQSPKAELLLKTKLIIWDEAPMMHRYCFEALNRTMQDIVGSRKPFGGKVLVLGGDFRQILPVLPRASRQDIVHSTINSSPLWKHCRVLTLSRNMRLETTSDSGDINKMKEFADWLLRLGNGNIGEPNDGDAIIEIPTDMLIEDSEDPFQDLLNFVYPNFIDKISTPTFFQERAVLAPTNDTVEFVNEYMLSQLPGEERVYYSSDTICTEHSTSECNAEIYSTEFLNSISCSGLPSHKLTLKVGAPVMLIRNIDQCRGLCNGTRLLISDMGNHLLNCKVLTGKFSGEPVFIPRMTLVPSNTSLPVKFQRRQFPIIASFAMTINKSQGQTLSHVGLYIPKPVFSHGQLYVALSRVRNRNGIKILIKPVSQEVSNNTLNVVYKEVFNRI